MDGYMGRMLWVDLTAETIEEMPLDDELCTQFIGGYGIGARLLLDRIPAGADPLGPDNVLGFITGPFTASRWTGLRLADTRVYQEWKGASFEAGSLPKGFRTRSAYGLLYGKIPHNQYLAMKK